MADILPTVCGDNRLNASTQGCTDCDLLEKRMDDLEAYVQSMDQFDIRVVSSLPAQGEEKVIYLISKSTPGASNDYDEYIYINNSWERLGDAMPDLSVYYTKAQVDAALALKQNTLTAGTNISIAPDGTISATDTTYTDATTSASGLMSSADKTKLDGIASGAEANVQSDWDQADPTADDFIKNKPVIPQGSVVDPNLNAMSTNPVTNMAIVEGLNDKTDLDVIAVAYDATATYAEGDYCIYNGIMYVCNADISTAEAFDSTHWDAVTVADEITDLKEDLSQTIQESAFRIVEENGNLNLYWYGASAECPYVIVEENGVYNLYFRYAA